MIEVGGADRAESTLFTTYRKSYGLLYISKYGNNYNHVESEIRSRTAGARKGSRVNGHR